MRFQPEDFRLTADQIDRILDRLVPLLAEPADHGFFRGVLRIHAEELDSSSFAVLVHKLLSAEKGK